MHARLRLAWRRRGPAAGSRTIVGGVLLFEFEGVLQEARPGCKSGVLKLSALPFLEEESERFEVASLRRLLVRAAPHRSRGCGLIVFTSINARPLRLLEGQSR